MPIAAVLWLGVGVIAAVAEGLTTQLVSIWFAVGALAAAASVFLGMTFPFQLLLFGLVSALLLFGTRPLLKKKLQVTKEPTNADQLLGKIGIVTDPSDSLRGIGRVMVLGMDWSARAQSGEKLRAGDRVEVLSIEGVTLVVRPVSAE